MLLEGLAEAIERGEASEEEFRAVICDEERLKEWAVRFSKGSTGTWEATVWFVRAGGSLVAWDRLVHEMKERAVLSSTVGGWVIAAEILQRLAGNSTQQKIVSDLVGRAWALIRTEDFTQESVALQVSLLRTLRFGLALAPIAARKAFFQPRESATEVYCYLRHLSLVSSSETSAPELAKPLVDEFGDLMGSLWMVTGAPKPGRKVEPEQEKILWDSLWTRTAQLLAGLLSRVFPTRLDDFSPQEAVSVVSESRLYFRTLHRLLHNGTSAGDGKQSHLGRVATVHGAGTLIKEISRVAYMPDSYMESIAGASGRGGAFMRSAVQSRQSARDFLSTLESTHTELFLSFNFAQQDAKQQAPLPRTDLTGVLAAPEDAAMTDIVPAKKVAGREMPNVNEISVSVAKPEKKRRSGRRPLLSQRAFEKQVAVEPGEDRDRRAPLDTSPPAPTVGGVNEPTPSGPSAAKELTEFREQRSSEPLPEMDIQIRSPKRARASPSTNPEHPAATPQPTHDAEPSIEAEPSTEAILRGVVCESSSDEEEERPAN